MSWGPSIRWMDDPITGQPIQVHGPLDAAAIYHDPSYRPGDINNMFPSYVARGHNGAILPGTSREGPPVEGVELYPFPFYYFELIY